MAFPTLHPATGAFTLTFARMARTTLQSELLSRYVNETGPADAYVRTSPIHGLGVFARRTFATGETILVWDERPVTPERPLDTAKDEFEEHTFRLARGQQVYLGYPERFVNHGCEPNAFLRRRNGRNHLVALRPIRPNEEILMHYAINLTGGEAWMCNCGATKCLGLVPGDFFSLPLDTQIELSALLQPWFIEEHRHAFRAFLDRTGLSEDFFREDAPELN